MFQLPQISTRNEMRILNWGHIAQITMVLLVIILAFVKIGSNNVRGRSDVWGLSVVSWIFDRTDTKLTRAGYQITRLLRLHDWNREDRETSKMVQPQSDHDPQLYRCCLLVRSYHHLLHGGKTMQWLGMHSYRLDDPARILTSVSLSVSHISVSWT